MKKISKYALGAMVSMSLFMQNAMAANDGLCDLIKGLSPVIKTLRTLAFVGAAFVLMDWAWGWIQKGEVGKETAFLFKDGFIFLICLQMTIHSFFHSGMLIVCQIQIMLLPQKIIWSY